MIRILFFQESDPVYIGLDPQLCLHLLRFASVLLVLGILQWFPWVGRFSCFKGLMEVILI